MTDGLRATGRVLRNLRHGGEVLADEAVDRADDAGVAEGLARASEVLPPDQGGDLEAVEFSTPFGYLFDRLAAEFPAHHLPGDPKTVTANLKALGAKLAEPEPAQSDSLEPAGNSTIPPVYTYWGQFIDHDLTANTDRQNTVTDLRAETIEPVDPATVTRDLRNLRQPSFNLDSVYGDGPSFEGEPHTAAAGFYDGPRLVIGTVAEQNDDGSAIAGDHVPGDAARDLPRDDAVARIGDARNDENLIVAQLHLGFLRFHNAVVDHLEQNGHAGDSPRQLFDAAQALVRYHYQWLVVNDFLRTLTAPGVVDDVLLRGNQVYAPRAEGPYMPLEFSVAAYRFGHSMVRFAYDYNRNFGRSGGGPGKVIPFAPFGLIFAFTGGAQPRPFVGATKVLPFNWVIEWDRFVDKGSPTPDHFARRIDTKLTGPLFDMINQVSGQDLQLPVDVQAVLKALAVRNLLRGYQLAVPTGQAVAGALGVPPLTRQELQAGNTAGVNQALRAGGFLDATPLWFYVLKEAEVRGGGNFLGEVGSRIVVETFLGQLRADPASYLAHDWTPKDGVTFPDGRLVLTIGDLLRFAGVLGS